jgi:hypothetical protein
MSEMNSLLKVLWLTAHKHHRYKAYSKSTQQFNVKFIGCHMDYWTVYLVAVQKLPTNSMLSKLVLCF